MREEDAMAELAAVHAKFVAPPDSRTLEGRMYNAASALMFTASLAAARLKDGEMPPLQESVLGYLRGRISFHLDAVQKLYPGEELDALIERDESLHGFARGWYEWSSL